ncbi:MAG: DEAD/DEAH box helicase [Planctomycetes bacterium]|nr:DEAD/DEAH box helicase [Planctomycetota bacterium]
MAKDAIHFLTIPPSREVAEHGLTPKVRAWFATTFGVPTPAQRCAWPTIALGRNLLLSAPTGSGKTLAAFVPLLNHLLTDSATGLRCLYVAPLKALVRDVRANLKQAVRSLRETTSIDLRIGLRTGDTSWRIRQRQLTDPPAILLTTPESFAQMLAQPDWQAVFRSLRWVVVDEIHALIGAKRGADLACSLERLDTLTPTPSQRIGLSATCAPLENVAEYLVGVGRSCTVASIADRTEKHFVIEPLFEFCSPLPLRDGPGVRAEAPTTGESDERAGTEPTLTQAASGAGWIAALLDRIEPELSTNRTTLLFTNTRNLAERLTWALRRRYPERWDDIAVHHSALSAARRRSVERRMKQGRLWAIVSSTSLELGIDIGSVDLVVFVHPPGAVVRLLQRVGRSGHRPDAPRRGLLLTASAGELLEAVVTADSGCAGQIEPVRFANAPLDVLCQQIVGIAMTGWATPGATFALLQKAFPFRHLAWDVFQDCLDYLSGRLRDGTTWLPARLRWDDGRFTIADDRTAKLLRRNLGTILSEDACVIRLRESAHEDADTKTLGEVDQVYADRLELGDRFVLDGRCLELKKRGAVELVVEEVFGRPQAPRWLGTGVPMPGELARRIFLFRAQAGEMLRDGDLAAWLRTDYRLDQPAIGALTDYVGEQESTSEIPTLCALTIECVAMQACTEYFVHTPLPRSSNETLARVLAQRWQRAKSKPCLALAADLGVYVMAFEPALASADLWREHWSTVHLERDFYEHLQGSDLLKQQFGRIAQTGLMILRNPAGLKRKVGGKDWTERRLFEQVRARCPNFVLLRQAQAEAITTTCDLAGALAFAEALARMPIRVRHLAKPSPFGETLMQRAAGFAPAAGQAFLPDGAR